MFLLAISAAGNPCAHRSFMHFFGAVLVSVNVRLRAASDGSTHPMLRNNAQGPSEPDSGVSPVFCPGVVPAFRVPDVSTYLLFLLSNCGRPGDRWGWRGDLVSWALGVDPGPRRGAFEGVLDPPKNNRTNVFLLVPK